MEKWKTYVLFGLLFCLPFSAFAGLVVSSEQASYPVCNLSQILESSRANSNVIATHSGLITCDYASVVSDPLCYSIVREALEFKFESDPFGGDSWRLEIELFESPHQFDAALFSGFHLSLLSSMLF